MFYTIGCIFLYKFAKTELPVMWKATIFQQCILGNLQSNFYLEIIKDMIYNTNTRRSILEYIRNFATCHRYDRAENRQKRVHSSPRTVTCWLCCQVRLGTQPSTLNMSKSIQVGFRQVKPILSQDKTEAKRRVLNLYKAWYRQIPFVCKSLKLVIYLCLI